MRAARELDQLAADAEERAAGAMDALLDLVAGIVAEAGSLEEVRARLLALNPEMPVRSLALALRQAQAVARLSGREFADGH